MRGIPRALILSLSLVTAGCSWFTDFKDQPKIEPWEAEYQGTTVGFRGQPQYSVPITGITVPQYRVSLGQYLTVMPATIDSMAAIPNPHPPTDASLENGRKYFEINCAVCHGPEGKGNGVMLQYGVAAPSLVTDRAKGLSDGYIFGIIRNGRVSMPSYDRIEEPDRWDVVNYIRGLQGVLGRPVPTGPTGRPGETGRTLPGATISGPTRPSPYNNPASATAVLMTSRPDSARRSEGTPGAAAPTPTPGAAGATPGGTDTTRRAPRPGGRP
jgi:mono/diheme cytochrome c family protein